MSQDQSTSHLYRLENTLVVVTSQRSPASWSEFLPGLERLDWQGFRSLFKENVRPSRGTGLSIGSSKLGSLLLLPMLGVDDDDDDDDNDDDDVDVNVTQWMTQTRTRIKFTIVVVSL